MNIIADIILSGNKEQICRFCLSTNNNEQSSPIFINEMATQLHENLKLVNILIFYDEIVPNSICSTCKDKIDAFVDFKNTILENERVLQEECKRIIDGSRAIIEELLQPEPDVDTIDDSDTMIYNPVKKKVARKKVSLKCENCDKSFSKAYINKHILNCKKSNDKSEETTDSIYTEIKSYICNICNSIFDTEVRLSLHYIQHVMFDTVEKVDLFLFCNYCGLILNNDEEYNMHIKDKHSELINSFHCQVCQTEFTTEFLLMEHIHCNDICRYISFQSKICLLCKTEITCPLAGHIKTHLLKRYSCPICKEKYITTIGFNNHLQQHPEYKHKCPHCYQMFLSKKNIDKHIKEIHNSDRYMCEVCSKIFNRKHNLTLHYRQKHDNKSKNYICSQCGYATRSNSELRKHERLHSDERPFKCTFVNCDKAYKTSSHLSHHVKTHLTIRNFVCDICDKSFYTSKNLKHHILAHTGVRDFKCTLCESTFKRRDQLVTHMKKKHGCLTYTYQGNNN